MRVGVCGALVALLAASPVFAQAAEQEQARARAALLAADKAWEEVYSAKDLERSVAACDDRASLLWPNTPIVVGKVAIARAIRGDFSEGDLSWRATAAGGARSGDLGYTSGSYESKLKGSAGGAVDKGKYLTVWKKEPDGAWEVLFDTFNSDLPAANN